MTSLNYTTHSIDSIVKSCLDISDPHLHFSNEPYDEKINGISYKVFQATINFLPHELTNFRCFNCGFTRHKYMNDLENLEEVKENINHLKKENTDLVYKANKAIKQANTKEKRLDHIINEKASVPP